MQTTLCGWMAPVLHWTHPPGAILSRPMLHWRQSCRRLEKYICRKKEVEAVAIFHFTVKIVGRSKGKSVISASAYLNGDVMKNDETGKFSYYTGKKEVVYR